MEAGSRSDNLLVIKIGTHTLLGTNDQPTQSFQYIARDIIEISKDRPVIVVTSGAIGFGVIELGLGRRPESTSSLQALSMIGQAGLLRRWHAAFAPVNIGQILVTRHDLEQAHSAQMLRDSIGALWDQRAIPIINENDAITTDEITFGDNDQLAAEISRLMGAKQLVLLTDQEGIMSHFGTADEMRMPVVSLMDAAREIVTTASLLGTGGADSKLVAAKLGISAGVEVFVGLGNTPNPVSTILAGKTGTKIIQ